MYFYFRKRRYYLSILNKNNTVLKCKLWSQNSLLSPCCSIIFKIWEFILMLKKKHKKNVLSHLRHIQLKWAACYLAYNDQVNVVCKAVIFLNDLTLRILEFLQWYQELGLVIFLFSLSKSSKKLFILPTDIHWVHTHTCMCLPAHMFTQTAYPCENRNLVFWCPLQKILRAKPFRPGK